MDAQALSQTAMEILTKLLTGTASGATESAGHELYSVVSRHLRSKGDAERLKAFEEDTSSVPARANFARSLTTHLDSDVLFRNNVRRLVSRVTMSDSSIRSNFVSADRGSTAVGGNLDQSTKKTTHFGGLVVGGVAVLVVLIVVVLGRVAYVVVNTVADAANGGLSGGSTCQDFIASADTEAKVGVMKKLYIENGKPKRAADVFILQNSEAMCGESPNVTLASLAASVPDFS